MSSIRITSIPDGQAPLWVRKEWVGVEMSIIAEESGDVATRPTSGLAHAISRPGSRLVGVLGGRASEANVDGYAVSVDTALRELARKSQSAANWFRENLSPGMTIFRFGEKFCEYLP